MTTATAGGVSPATATLIAEYASTWRMLAEYDEGGLDLPIDAQPSPSVLAPAVARQTIAELQSTLIAKGEASLKAAHLLYVIVKDRPFSDGNKRIASLLFLLYLKQEGVEHQITPHALTALTLLIAESAPASKDLMTRLVVNLLLDPLPT